MVLTLAESADQMNESLIHMLNSALETNLSVSETRREHRMIDLFGSGIRQAIEERIPEGIRFLASVEQQMQCGDDYHDGITFELWIVMYVVAEWSLEILGSGKEIQKQMMNCFDNLNLFIEETLMIP